MSRLKPRFDSRKGLRPGHGPAILGLLVACVLAVLPTAACGAPPSSPVVDEEPRGKADREAWPAQVDTAILAGGCFWCMEPSFEKLDGVLAVTSGYAGGQLENPTYEQVSRGATKHAEVVRIEYDPTKISYEELLQTYWRQIDPTDAGGQFADRGSQYRTAIFYLGEEQRRLAEASKSEIADSGRFDSPIATEIVAAGPFYPAEEYHQDYYKKKPCALPALPGRLGARRVSGQDLGRASGFALAQRGKRPRVLETE